MPLVLDVPSSLEKERRAQAVRSSLSPEKRFTKDKQGYRKQYQSALLSDANQRAAQSVASDAGRSRTVFEAQKGLLLDSSVIISRLKTLNSTFEFQRSIARPEIVGIYQKSSLPEHQPEGLAFTGVSFNHGPNPEFAVLKKEENYVAHDGQVHIGECKGVLYPGWRTMLARLIRKRMISEVKAELLFGLPTNQSQFWATATGKRSSL